MELDRVIRTWFDDLSAQQREWVFVVATATAAEGTGPAVGSPLDARSAAVNA